MMACVCVSMRTVMQGCFLGVRGYTISTGSDADKQVSAVASF